MLSALGAGRRAREGGSPGPAVKQRRGFPAPSPARFSLQAATQENWGRLSFPHPPGKIPLPAPLGAARLGARPGPLPCGTTHPLPALSSDDPRLRYPLPSRPARGFLSPTPGQAFPWAGGGKGEGGAFLGGSLPLFIQAPELAGVKHFRGIYY